MRSEDGVSRRRFLKAGVGVSFLLSPTLHAFPQSAVSAQGEQENKGLDGPFHEYRDEKTGARVRVLTPGPERDQVIYQTHPMWTPNMTHLVFNSRPADGNVRPHALDMKTGATRCLIERDAEDWVLARKDDRLYLRRGDDVSAVHAADFSGASQPEEKVAAFEGLAALKPISMSLDANEKAIYVGGTLEDGKRWGITELDLASSRVRTITEVGFRVGHIQANPVTPGIILFCHETGGDAPQRTWVVNADGTGLRPFYKETYDEWVTHEVWWGADRAAFTIWPYDDIHLHKPHGVVSADLATGTPTVHSQYPAWHTHGSPDRRWLLGDDFDRNLWLIRVEAGQRRLLTQGHNGAGFDTHPHASFTPDSKAVVFNSSRNGTEDILLVELPEWDALPTRAAT